MEKTDVKKLVNLMANISFVRSNSIDNTFWKESTRVDECRLMGPLRKKDTHLSRQVKVDEQFK